MLVTGSPLSKTGSTITGKYFSKEPFSPNRAMDTFNLSCSVHNDTLFFGWEIFNSFMFVQGLVAKVVAHIRAQPSESNKVEAGEEQ